MLAKIKFTKKERTLLLVWLIIISFFLVDTGIRRICRTMNRLDEEIKLSQEKYARLLTLSAQAENIDSIYSRVVRAMPALPDFEAVLRVIETVKKDSGIDILNVKPVTARDEGVYVLYTLKIEAQDEVADIAAFLFGFQQALPGAGIERLEINAQRIDQLPKATLLLQALGFK